MNKLDRALVAALLTVSVPGLAMGQEQEPAASGTGTEQPALFAGDVITMSATVEAIDLEKRLVTLKGPEGNVMTLKVSEEARNLPQVKVGDVVTIGYREALAVALQETGTGITERKETISGTRAPLGAMPAGTVTTTVDVTGNVQSIDLAKRIVKIKGPTRTVSVHVAPGISLKDIEVGDQVQATYVEELAISVTRPPQ